MVVKDELCKLVAKQLRIDSITADSSAVIVATELLMGFSKGIAFEAVQVRAGLQEKEKGRKAFERRYHKTLKAINQWANKCDYGSDEYRAARILTLQLENWGRSYFVSKYANSCSNKESEIVHR